jgi:hypothetical protein
LPLSGLCRVIPAYNIPVCASQRPLPDATQELPEGNAFCQSLLHSLAEIDKTSISPEHLGAAGS